MFESFSVQENELKLPVVKSRNAYVGAAAERCACIVNALEKAAVGWLGMISPLAIVMLNMSTMI